MSVTKFSSREFNQDTSGAKKAALKGPVYITDRGKPAHVLLTFDEYLKLTGANISLLEAVAQKDDLDIEFDVPKLGNGIVKQVDLS
jgi:PHD/YefM family antitoxin component YafN of YafNO toxin-antitoxin module